MNAPVAPGQFLAEKYRVEEVLGRGAMGVVVSAVHEKLRQRVAIKFLLDTASPDMVERFLREARAAVRLKSEHVARVIDVGELANGAPYMVMEHLSGEDLGALVKRTGPLPIADAVECLLHVCEAMAEAHALGIVHRDLKPANLFATTAADGSRSIKVLDFGISKETARFEEEPEAHLTTTDTILGSPLYMAIEQMRSSRDVDARADIWSMGAILYKLTTNHVPFECDSLPELMMKVATEAPPKPSRFRADLPQGLDEAILRCLEKDPARRFAGVADLARAIAPYGPEAAPLSVERARRTLGVPELEATVTGEAGAIVAAVVEERAAEEATLQVASRPSNTGPSNTAPAWSATADRTAKRGSRGLVYGLVALGFAVIGGTALVGRMSQPGATTPAGGETATPSPVRESVKAPEPASPTLEPSKVAAAPPSSSADSVDAPRSPRSKREAGRASKSEPAKSANDPRAAPATTAEVGRAKEPEDKPEVPPPAPPPRPLAPKNPLDIEIK